MRRIFLVLLMVISMLLPIGCSMFIPVPEKALSVAVMIDNCTENKTINFNEKPNNGSGVLYHKKGNKYFILTNRHIVPNKRYNCQVFIYDQKTKQHSHQEAIETITFPDDFLDVAILQFTSNNKYPTAKLGDSNKIKVGDTIYIAGAPKTSPDFPIRSVLVKEGNIENTKVTDKNEEGYQWIYSNQTTNGMSGAPILDTGGRLVGIHGKTDSREGYKANLGIPLALFKDYIISKSSEKSPPQDNLLATIPIWVWIVTAIIWIVWGILSIDTLKPAIALPFLFVSGVLAGFGCWLLAQDLVVFGVLLGVVFGVLLGVVFGVQLGVKGVVRGVEGGLGVVVSCVWIVVWFVVSAGLDNPVGGVVCSVVLGPVCGVVNDLIADSSNRIPMAILIVIVSGLGGVLGYYSGGYLLSVL